MITLLDTASMDPSKINEFNIILFNDFKELKHKAENTIILMVSK